MIASYNDQHEPAPSPHHLVETQLRGLEAFQALGVENSTQRMS